LECHVLAWLPGARAWSLHDQGDDCGGDLVLIEDLPLEAPDSALDARLRAILGASFVRLGPRCIQPPPGRYFPFPRTPVYDVWTVTS
jgi:hypothetical protein